MRHVFERVMQVVRTGDIRLLVYSTVLVPVVLMLAWAFGRQSVFPDQLPERYTSGVFAVSMLISSLGGLVQIIRRESPGLMGVPFRGLFPVLTGLLWVAVSWVLAGAMLLALFS